MWLFCCCGCGFGGSSCGFVGRGVGSGFSWEGVFCGDAGGGGVGLDEERGLVEVGVHVGKIGHREASRRGMTGWEVDFSVDEAPRGWV